MEKILSKYEALLLLKKSLIKSESPIRTVVMNTDEIGLFFIKNTPMMIIYSNYTIVFKPKGKSVNYIRLPRIVIMLINFVYDKLKNRKNYPGV